MLFFYFPLHNYSGFQFLWRLPWVLVLMLKQLHEYKLTNYITSDDTIDATVLKAILMM